MWIKRIECHNVTCCYNKKTKCKKPSVTLDAQGRCITTPNTRSSKKLLIEKKEAVR